MDQSRGLEDLSAQGIAAATVRTRFSKRCCIAESKDDWKLNTPLPAAFAFFCLGSLALGVAAAADDLHGKMAQYSATDILI